MKKTYVTDMTVGKPLGLLVSFMLPLLIGNIFQQLYNVVDSIIVGQYVGADALAAVGATGSLNFLIFSLCGGMANGTGVVISQHFGAGKNDQVKNTIINAAYIMLFCAVLMGGIGVIFARKILIFLNTPDNILDSSTLYMTIICCGILGVSLYNAVSAILRAVGDSRTPLYFLMVSSVVNIVLDLLFIRGFSWGVAGAAIATIIAQLISGIGSLIFALVKNPFFRIEKKYRSLNRGIIWQCIRMGVPLAFQSSLIAISCVALQSVVNTFGSVVVAAFTATSRIEQLVQQPYNSLGMSVSTYTGQNIGAGQLERVKKGYRIAFLLMAVFSFTMLPLAQFFGNPIMRLFVSEPEVIEMGAHALKLTSWFYLPLGMIYITRGLLNGAGDAAFAFMNGIIEMMGRICFAKPLTLIPQVGVWGVWLATAFTWLLTGVLTFLRYLQGKWKKHVTPKETGQEELVEV